MVERTALPRSASHVMVACKLPNGLILHIDDIREVNEATPTGFHKIKKAFPRDEKYTLRGCAIPRNGRVTQPIPNGYSLTRVPRDFWEEWLRQNKDSDVVLNHIIFAQAGYENIEAKTKEHKKTRSGLEPIDPEKPPKVGLGKMQITTYNPDDDNE